MLFDILLKNGRILDGAGNPWFKADVAIKDGRIKKIGRLESSSASRTIDVGGQIICPGFIDIHSHSDTTILLYPRMESMVFQGITTNVNGNCGSSPAPVNENMLKFKKLRNIPEEDVDWTTMAGYFRRLERQGMSQNVVTLVGHGTVRYYVMGDSPRISTPSELEEMKGLVRQAMKDGATGLSTGLAYGPGCYAQTSEVIELAKVAAEYDGIYTSHIRDWGSKVLGWSGDQGSKLEGITEAIEIGRKSGVRVEVSHIIAHRVSELDPDTYNKTRCLFDSAREEKIDVTADVIPSDWGGIQLITVRSGIPPEYLEDGVEKLLERLIDPDTRAKIKEDMMTKKPSELGFVYPINRLLLLRMGKGDCIMIYPPFNAHLKNREYERKTLEEIAKIMGKDLLDTYLDLIVEEEGNIYVNTKLIDFELRMSEFTWPITMVCSDGGSIPSTSLAKEYVHRRNFGAFPRALAWVREKNVITLEDMVRRMTSLPARTLGLKDRGLMKEGFWSDITVFNPETIKDRCTSEKYEYPEGIPYVLVNGQLVVDKSEHTGALPGKVLRHPF